MLGGRLRGRGDPPGRDRCTATGRYEGGAGQSPGPSVVPAPGPSVAPASGAYARARSSPFTTLPLAFRGSSPTNSTARGTL